MASNRFAPLPLGLTPSVWEIPNTALQNDSVKNTKFNENKGPFTLRQSEHESEKDQRTSERDQGKNVKHHRKISLLFSSSLDVNGP